MTKKTPPKPEEQKSPSSFAGSIVTYDAEEAALPKLGPGSANVKILSNILGFSFSQRGNKFFFTDKDPDLSQLGKKALRGLIHLPTKDAWPSPWEVECLGALLDADPDVDLESFFHDSAASSASKDTHKRVVARTQAQKDYIEAIRSSHLTFGLGPAGTGKTYLAVAMAVEALLSGEVKRIILTRPAVEAGEHLGYLPGDLADKVDPYLRPLFDAIEDLLPQDDRGYRRGNGRRYGQNFPHNYDIEVAPLAFMRGRTLSRAFVILDEAQNTSREQLKMFLTRLGPGAKMVVTADPGQSDLPGGEPSGLIEAERILSGINGVSFCFFTQNDSVRHHLVRDILAAYETVGLDELSQKGAQNRLNKLDKDANAKYRDEAPYPSKEPSEYPSEEASEYPSLDPFIISSREASPPSPETEKKRKAATKKAKAPSPKSSAKEAPSKEAGAPSKEAGSPAKKSPSESPSKASPSASSKPKKPAGVKASKPSSTPGEADAQDLKKTPAASAGALTSLKGADRENH
jgi:phosphate starvation-inducible PhoH-like protein